MSLLFSKSIVSNKYNWFSDLPKQNLFQTSQNGWPKSQRNIGPHMKWPIFVTFIPTRLPLRIALHSISYLAGPHINTSNFIRTHILPIPSLQEAYSHLRLSERFISPWSPIYPTGGALGNAITQRLVRYPYIINRRVFHMLCIDEWTTHYRVDAVIFIILLRDVLWTTKDTNNFTVLFDSTERKYKDPM